MSSSLIILAGGRGRRFRSPLPKQYHPLTSELTVLQAVVKAFDGLLDKIVVVISRDDRDLFLKQGLQLDYCYGGETRQASVRAGLEFLQQFKPKKLLIHDSARPFLDKRIISDLLIALDRYEAADLALPIRDTIKTYDGKILDRDRLYITQTPQAFHYEVILKLHRETKRQDHPDDMSLYLEAGLKNYCLVKGAQKNIKITYKTDLYEGD